MRDMNAFNGTAAVELTELDIIEELITEDRERPAASLPGPPPPPAELLCQQISLNQNHTMLRPSPSGPAQPVLVARGTATQPRCSFPQPAKPQSSSSTDMASARPCRGSGPSSSSSSQRGRGSKGHAGSSPAQGLNNTEMLERFLDNPKLVVVEEPKERGMRFRYECEGRSAGSILGASSTETNKTQPAIEIQGPIDRIKKVQVTSSLVTKDYPYRPHPHCLVGKDCPDGSGICLVTLNPHSNRHHSFSNLGIQCVRRKELDASLQKRRSQNIDPFRTGHSKGIEDMDMNVVRLCFQCELEWDDGKKECLGPVVSNPIYDKKATTTSQLKISSLNLNRGPCNGKTEIYMLCDKVQKDDIEIIFRRGSWKANGEFAQTDVHRQIAIVFKTPPYQDQDIAEEVEVRVVLRRLSDQMESEAITFTYLPCNPDPYEVKRKRKIKTDISFRDKPCLAETPAAAELPSSSQPFHFPAEGTLPPAQPGVSSASGKMFYCDHQDSHLNQLTYEGPDEMAILNQLMEIPEVRDMLSEQSLVSSMSTGFDQGPDANATFANMDVNFNQNIWLYSQDMSQYHDLQFNQLVNESLTQQPDATAQESPAHTVQVKREEEEEEEEEEEL
ncbi:proto-oncogene c-Rel isoform X2 [Genypterus blacodes]|uniref:proto-oncogene c-Rel isoform X2 n=1 Tax=Genypterus blacodes TaxID=154954 RepID=UPI003F767939